MKEVLTIAGPTLETGSAVAVKEWCINTAAVDPATQVDPRQQRGRLAVPLGAHDQPAAAAIQLTSGIGESYTPTVIGADGAVYAVNNAMLFSIGR